MPRRRATFPSVFFQYADKAARGERIPPIPMQDKKAADSTRHAWHRFRIFLIDEQHPHAEAVLDLIARITNIAPPGKQGEYVLEFTPRGLYNLAQELKGKKPLIQLDKHDLPSFDPLPIPDGVNAEELITRMMGQKDKKIPECLHEADATGTHCIKCNKPMV